MPPPARPPVEEAAAGETAPPRELRPPGRFAQPSALSDAVAGLVPCDAHERGTVSPSPKPETRDGTPTPSLFMLRPDTKSKFSPIPFLFPGEPPAKDTPGHLSPQKFYKQKSGRVTWPSDGDFWASQGHRSLTPLPPPRIAASWRPERPPRPRSNLIGLLHIH
jgi:hypothetical protein